MTLPLWFWFLLPVFFLLGTASAAVSALETAFLSLDAQGRQSLRRLSPTAAKHMEKRTEDARLTQHTLLLGDSLLNLLLLMACFAALPALVRVSSQWSHSWPAWSVAALLFGSVVFFAEVLPKLIALHYPARVLAHGWWLLEGLHEALTPLAGRLRRMFGWFPRSSARPDLESSRETARAELSALAEIAAEEGSLSPEEATAFREIIRLGGESAAHCLTPRVDCFLLPDELSREDAAQLLRTRRYQRVPVRGENPDDLLGVLDVSRFFLHPETPYADLLEPTGFIPDSMPALDLLQNFLLGRRRLAILLDEYGGFEGLVTLSDLLDEILGEQGPHSGSGLYLEDLGEGRFLAGGHTRLDDLGDRLHTDWPGTQADTLGGLLLEKVGRVPRPGSTVGLGPWQATIRRASRKRIKEVLLEKIPPPTATTPEEQL